MLNRSAVIPDCPACGASDAVPLGIAAAEERREPAAPSPAISDARRIVELSYGCRSCGEVFSMTHHASRGPAEAVCEPHPTRRE